jgi:hypothetical protein
MEDTIDVDGGDCACDVCAGISGNYSAGMAAQASVQLSVYDVLIGVFRCLGADPVSGETGVAWSACQVALSANLLVIVVRCKASRCIGCKQLHRTCSQRHDVT